MTLVYIHKVFVLLPILHTVFAVYKGRALESELSMYIKLFLVDQRIPLLIFFSTVFSCYT